MKGNEGSGRKVYRPEPFRIHMIKVTRLNGKTLRLNAEYIVSIESVPDTLITLRTGKTLMVREPEMLLVKRFLRYQRKIRARSWARPGHKETGLPAKGD